MRAFELSDLPEGGSLKFFAIECFFFFFQYQIIEFVSASARNITIFVVRSSALYANCKPENFNWQR